MTLIDFYSKLLTMGVPFFKTRDVAMYCQISNAHASQLLLRLTKSHQVISLKKGLWGLSDKIDPLMLPLILTMPSPSYISLQTALYYRGLISQIPSIIYAVSIARPRVYHTDMATVSIHHINPEMFLGFKEIAPYIYMATAEKALVDFLYLSQSSTRQFTKLPELEITEMFKNKLAIEYINKIPHKNRQTRVMQLFHSLSKKT